MIRSINIAALRSTVLAIAILATTPGTLPAQSSPRHTNVVWADPAVVTLMLVDVLPAPSRADGRAVVIRRPGEPPNNIILVTNATAPSDLSAAVTALAFSRRSQGDQVRQELRTVIRSTANSARRLTRDDWRADRDLQRVQLAPRATIASIGARGPSIMVRMSSEAVARGRSSALPKAKPSQARPRKAPSSEVRPDTR